MPVPGADSARQAVLPCLGSADAKATNAVGALQIWSAVCCLPQPFYYLAQQITLWHLGAEENLVSEGAHFWNLQHLYFWVLLVYPVPQLLLSSWVVISPLKDYSGLSLICLLSHITNCKNLLLPSPVSATHNLDPTVLHFMNIKARLVGF